MYKYVYNMYINVYKYVYNQYFQAEKSQVRFLSHKQRFHTEKEGSAM